MTRLPIQSILDNDLYKFWMQSILFKCPEYANAQVEYKFYDRNKQRDWTDISIMQLQHYINCMGDLALLDTEKKWCQQNIKTISNDAYWDYLEQFRFDPSQVDLHSYGDYFKLNIKGKWIDTILWEVPLLALISHVYYTHRKIILGWNQEETKRILYEKKKLCESNYLKIIEFGTRRRRNFETQDKVNNILSKKITDAYMSERNVLDGTSNVYFAKKYNLSPIGSIAHEFIMGISVLESLNRPNRQTMNIISSANDKNIIQPPLIMLTDTFTTDHFLKDFNRNYCKIFDGVRQDSGNPFRFADKIVQHYRKNGIDHKTKQIIFSDSLTIDKAIEIKKHCNNIGIQSKFGIGTHLTNDFPGSPPLNIVIKLDKVNGQNVVKLSDDSGKQTGSVDMIKLIESIIIRN